MTPGYKFLVDVTEACNPSGTCSTTAVQEDVGSNPDKAGLGDNHYVAEKVPDTIADSVEKLLSEVTKEDRENIYSVVWDFGGQFVYYVTHPLFLTQKAIYLLTYDLSQNPQDRANPPVKQGRFQKVKDNFCLKTNLDYLDFWMTHVASLARGDQNPLTKGHQRIKDDEIYASPKTSVLPEKCPPVFLVFTHADKPYGGGDPYLLAREIFGFLQFKPYKAHLFQDIFVVDNTKSGSVSECPDVVRLRKEVLAVAKELPQIKEVIPIMWLRYEKELQAMKEMGHKHISLGKAKQIASEVCNIKEDREILTLLNFLHDQRVVIHFDDTPLLKNLVVLDSQWLVDVLKEVITIQPYDPKETAEFQTLWERLEQTGIIEAELLEHVLCPLFDHKETSESLIEIMEKFSLLCPLPSLNASCSKQYLVPSMLMSLPPKHIIKLVASAQLPSLFLRFDSGLVPAGLFPRLAVKFFQWWTVEFPSQQIPQFFHNFARFFLSPDEGGSVVFLCHSSSVEVIILGVNDSLTLAGLLRSKIKVSARLRREKTDNSPAHFVRSQLALMIDSMRNEFFWIKNMKCEMSFLCPVCCHQGAVNFCRNHRAKGCKQEECLHFFSEAELYTSTEALMCIRAATAKDNRVPLKQFAPWFTFGQKEVSIN